MRMQQLIAGAAFGAAAVLGGSAAVAQSTFSAAYYTVSPLTADFNDLPCGPQDCGQNYTNNLTGEVTTTLLDGLPVYNTGFTGQALSDLNGNGTLAWWNGTPTSVGSVSTPINFTDGTHDLFPPNGTGSGDGAGFQTAIFTGTLDVTNPAGANVTFNLASDDDSFLAVDNSVIAQDGGIHPLGSGVSVTQHLAEGDHAVTIFYADRHVVDAQLTFSEAVPEPATWAMMLVGFGGMGAAIRARRKSLATTA